MENSLKQRIVGAIVLVALAVVFLPAILKDKPRQEDFNSKIPEKPKTLTEYTLSDEIKNKNNALQQHLDTVEKLEQRTPQQQLPKDDLEQLNEKVNSETVNKSDNSVADSKRSANTKETFVDAAWVIQLASFSSKNNADNMVERLKVKGYKSYTRTALNNKNVSVHRVFVGPYIEKEKAEADKLAVEHETRLKGLLIKYDPVSH
ncbi:MAG: SPOR domain-containing protein [Gammaproteobacteria bacterium]|nr:SPOR domain-containing protein [Gammaproteobacteria bacterium]